jgi:hypothetical protein
MLCSGIPSDFRTPNNGDELGGAGGGAGGVNQAEVVFTEAPRLRRANAPSCRVVRATDALRRGALPRASGCRHAVGADGRLVDDRTEKKVGLSEVQPR